MDLPSLLYLFSDIRSFLICRLQCVSNAQILLLFKLFVYLYYFCGSTYYFILVDLPTILYWEIYLLFRNWKIYILFLIGRRLTFSLKWIDIPTISFCWIYILFEIGRPIFLFYLVDLPYFFKKVDLHSVQLIGFF